MVDLVTAASRSDVRGVVEYEVIAENPTGFGKSVAATRRIWGGVTADRWIVTASRSDCPITPGRAAGDRWYLLVGIESTLGGPVFGEPSQEELSDLERNALASIVGEPVSIEVGTTDRSMAWLRVMWWPILLLSLPLVLVAAVVRRRRAGARRDYLF